MWYRDRKTGGGWELSLSTLPPFKSTSWFPQMEKTGFFVHTGLLLLETKPSKLFLQPPAMETTWLTLRTRKTLARKGELPQGYKGHIHSCINAYGVPTMCQAKWLQNRPWTQVLNKIMSRLLLPYAGVHAVLHRGILRDALFLAQLPAVIVFWMCVSVLRCSGSNGRTLLLWKCSNTYMNNRNKGGPHIPSFSFGCQSILPHLLPLPLTAPAVSFGSQSQLP